MPIHGQLNVRALNDGFTALDSVAAMSQSGRLPTAVPSRNRPLESFRHEDRRPSTVIDPLQPVASDRYREPH
jgi:hypothetical protein